MFGRVTEAVPQQRRFATSTFHEDYRTRTVTDLYVHPITQDVFLCSFHGHSIVRIRSGSTTEASSDVVAGTWNTRGYNDGTGADALFNLPFSLTGNGGQMLYVSDQYNNRIRSIDMTDDVLSVSTLAGSGTAGWFDAVGTNALFNSPAGIALNVNCTTLYVADSNSQRIRRINISLNL